MKHLLLCLTVYLSFGSSWSFLAQIAARLPLPGNPSPPGSPWPLPETWNTSDQVFTLSSPQDFKYALNTDDCDILNWAVKRYSYRFLTQNSEEVSPATDIPALSTVSVVIPWRMEDNLCNTYPKLADRTDYEYYAIEVELNATGAPSATITAGTVWGALRGLETFSQLLWRDRDWRLNHYYINHTRITDKPRYRHRGIMLDTARHFIPPDTIQQVLEAMAYNKMNVLHWHISDDQSFPLVTQKFPQLSDKGAYIPGELIYNGTAVERIKEEARLRGIRVIFEIDSPGHTLVFGKAFPELLTPCYGDGVNPGTPNYPKHAAAEILDPTKENTYTFMRELFSDLVRNISKDQFVHLGMDEVYYDCWESSPEIREFMQANNYTNYSQVQDHYTKRHLSMVKSLGARPIIWQDATDHDVELDNDVVVQVWKTDQPWENYMQRLLDRNFSTLLSSCWYLNYISYGASWRDYYECDPELSLPNPIPIWQRNLILGGEAAIWGEYVDATNLVSRLFPFVGAVAERLWSPVNSSTTDDAMWRLDEHRCRMLGGIPAQPIFNGYCFPQEFSPRSKMKT